MKQDKKRLRLPIIFTVIVSVFGFGVMLLSWKTIGTSYTGERGFFYYKAATWGDGLFLPILVGSALTYILLGPSLSDRQKRICFGIGVIGAIIGVLMQFSWLESDTLVLNWTIPSLHHFNVAGRYHAVYFFLMFGLIFALVTGVLLSSHNNRKIKESLSRIICYAAVWFSGSGYFFLHVLDDWDDVYNNGFSLTLVIFVAILIPMIFSLLFRLFNFSNILNDFRAVLSGTLSSFGICALIAHHAGEFNVTTLSFPIMFLCLSIMLILPKALQPESTIKEMFFVAFPAFGLGIFIVSIPNDLIMMLSPFISIIILVFIAFIQNNNLTEKDIDLFKKDVNILGILALLPVSIFGLFFKENEYISILSKEISKEIISLLIYLIALKIVTYWIKQQFENIKNLETNKQTAFTIEEVKPVLSAHTIFYMYIGIVSFGFILLILSTLFGTINLFHDISNAWQLPAFTLKSIISLLVFCFAALLLFLLGNQKSKMVKYFCLPLIIIAYIGIFVFVGDLRKPFITSYWDLFLLALVPGASFFIANGFISNIRLIRGMTGLFKKKDYLTLLATVMIFIGTFFVTVESILPTQGEYGVVLPSLVSPFLGIIGCLFASVVMPLLIARIFVKDVEFPDPQVLQNNAQYGVGQDSIMGWCIIIFGGLFVMHYIETNESIVHIVINLLTVFATMYMLIPYPLKNNEFHLNELMKKRFDNMLKQYKDEPEKLQTINQQWIALKAHLERQAQITVFALLPWSYIVIFIGWLRNLTHRPENRIISLSEFMYKQYLFECLTKKYRRLNNIETGSTETM